MSVNAVDKRNGNEVTTEDEVPNSTKSDVPNLTKSDEDKTRYGTNQCS